jgi:hypothetical protein
VEAGGTVILGPRDLKPQQLKNLAEEINSLPGGKVLLDPQFYLPYADHERLTSHDYWPTGCSTDSFWSGADVRSLLQILRKLNDLLGCESIILPSLFAEALDDDWLSRQKRSSFDETADAHELASDQAETLLTTLRNAGVRGQLRDFTDCIDVNRAALSVIRTTRGPLLRRKWSSR